MGPASWLPPQRSAMPRFASHWSAVSEFIGASDGRPGQWDGGGGGGSSSDHDDTPNPQTPILGPANLAALTSRHLVGQVNNMEV